jgi:dipeptidyl aminopeptidase/acylaminoacyl peptidase
MSHRLSWVALSVVVVVLGCGGADENAAPVVAPPPVPAPVPPPPPPPPPHAPKAPVALEEYFKIGRVTGLSFSADEKLVAYMSDEAGRPDVWVRPLAGGPGSQVTHVEGFVHSFAFSPTHDQLVFEADKGGDELPHLYLTSSRGEAPKDLVADLPAGRRTMFVRWSDDGAKLLFLSSARDEKIMDLYEHDLKSAKTTLVWKGDGKVDFSATTRDHRRFVMSETHSDADNDLYLVDRIAPEKRTLLTKHDGSVLYSPQYFSRDGRKLFFTSDEGGEFTKLSVMDLVTHKVTPVLSDEWDVEASDESRSGRYTFTKANADGAPKLVLTEHKRVDRAKEKNPGGPTSVDAPVLLPAPPTGGAWDAFDSTRSGPMELGFSKTERYFGVVLRGDTAPAAPFVIDLKEGRVIPVLDPRPASLKDRPMVTALSVHVPSFDGQKVPAFLYAPPGEGPFPAIIDVHGGPTAQSHRDFSRMRQYLVSKGYVVLVPNVRGSTGYGKTWTRLDNLDLGGGPLKDIVACKKYLVDHAHVAADKVAVMGGSYGGYMALAAAAFTPAEFAVNVDYFGVSDLKSLVESFPPYWASAASYIYQKFGDPKNPAHAAYQHDRSPLNFVDQMTRPLLVVQGEKDARVKADQSERIVAALKRRQVPVHYLVLPGEGHGFTKNENYLRAYQTTDRFLDRYLWGDTSVTVD